MNEDNPFAVQFDCPSNDFTTNPSNTQYLERYEKDSLSKGMNAEQYRKEFRLQDYDDWGTPFWEVKQHETKWKQRYGKYISQKDGATIYESASGIGLNLYMTVEILQEQGFTNLQVYGNEYVAESVHRSDDIWDHIAPPNSSKGKFCAADSTDLTFVPDNSFDLVYTGYITPNHDPLKLGKGFWPSHNIMKDMCSSGHRRDVERRETFQRLQEDWYATWVNELIRIAKPGAPIGIEQVSKPYCWNPNDFGGVWEHWWKRAINTYGWDVDPISVQIQYDTLFGERRYHVLLVKNEERPSPVGETEVGAEGAATHRMRK